MDHLLAEHLTDRLESAVHRHFAVATDWLPHEYVPWEQGRDFASLPWEETQSALSAPVRAAVALNLLTEDNLPGYHATLSALYGDREPWRAWLDRWTAEEGRHGIVLRDYLIVTRAVDPVALERDRMATVSGGYRAPDKDVLRAVCYVSFQELATRVSHRGTGRLSGDPGLDRLLARVATDENLHMVLYRDLVQAALEAAPDATLRAIADEVIGFAMPGTGIPQFARRAAVVAKAGIYDLQVHRDEVLQPLLRYWKVFEMEGLDPVGEQARDDLVAVIRELDRRVVKLRERRAAVSA
jgi:acyl-[acyl-carrier-protein] desaturase